jgi:hypothetical protein
MKIERKKFEVPTEDIHSLKVVEIGEIKEVQTPYGPKDKFNVKIEVLDQKATENDEPIYIFQSFAPSIGEKAILGKFLRRLGFNTTEEFEMDDLLGFKFSAAITHNTGKNGNLYANLVIETVKALKQGKSVPAAAVVPAPSATVTADEDIPF